MLLLLCVFVVVGRNPGLRGKPGKGAKYTAVQGCKTKKPPRCCDTAIREKELLF